MWRAIIKTENQIKVIRDSGKYLNELLYLIYQNCKPWVSLLELEDLAQSFIEKNNLKGAFKWYMWFPANLCLSVNDCVVHWIPNNYILKDWDLLKVDSWVIYKKWFSDSAFSIIIGWDDKDVAWAELIKITKKALDVSINFLLSDSYSFDYSKSVQDIVENAWFCVIRDLTGHWVWTKVHEAPHIFNWTHPDTKKIKIKKNMVLALEPITSFNSKHVINKKWNSWNLYTSKWDKWAQWEYMILVKDDNIEVLSWLQIV